MTDQGKGMAMARERLIPAAVAAVVILTFGVGVRADTKVIISHHVPRSTCGLHGRVGLGTWIGPHGRTPVWHGPVHGRGTLGSPWTRRFVRIGPCPVERVQTVVVRPPVVRVVPPPVKRHISVAYVPTVSCPAPAPVAKGSVTVWITNSNGSRSSVTLQRQGPWYFGPRGEYYTEMPTNEQLRVVYGF